MVSATVADESEMARAMPKSMTLTWPAAVTMMLPGLMSRCTTPARCEYSRAVRMPLDDLRGLGGRHRALGDDVLEQASLDVLHDDERHERLDAGRLAHDLLAGVEDAHDRGVRHLRGGLRLPAEPRAEGGVVRERRLEQLDRDAAAEPAVGADVDVGHAAAPDEFADLVAAREHAHVLRYAVNHELSPGASRWKVPASVPARV